jgi:hypothetical protein
MFNNRIKRTIMTNVNKKIENGSSLYKNSIYIHSKINKLYCYNLFLTNNSSIV